MRVSGVFVTGFVALVFWTGVASAQPQSPQGDTDPACPPGQLCLPYEPSDRLGRSVDVAEYPYRFHDPYLATITASAMSPDGLTPGVKREIVRVPGLPGRDRLPMLSGRGEISVALYRQHRPAPLVFVLGGMGSNPFFGPGPFYAALLHKQGAHAVVLPSPLNWNFALAASRSGTPGYTPDDARDLYALVQATVAFLRSRHGLEVTGVEFMGVSLGALEGAYLSVLDADEGKVGIRRYLLLNPPLDLAYTLARLSEWQALGARLGKERAIDTVLKARGLIEDYIEDRRRNPNASFDRVEREFARFSTEELQYVLGQYLRLGLPELVYVTQAIHDQGVLAAPRDQGRKRLQAARAFTLKGYEEKIVVPQRQLQDPGANAESVNERGSLWPTLERLRANPRVHIMHNADDVLVARPAIEELKEIMGDRMTVYPYGGHLGNLWYARNQEDILRFFAGTTADLAEPSAPRSTAFSRPGSGS